MYFTVIKHFGHLRTLEKCRKHSLAARVVYISLVFSNARRVLSQCNTRLRLLYLLIVSHCKSREKLKTMLMQNFGRQTKSVRLFLKVAYFMGNMTKDQESTYRFKQLFSVEVVTFHQMHSYLICTS